jgi:hypothetical protein
MYRRVSQLSMERTMIKRDSIRIELSTEQKDQIKEATGRDVQGLDLDIRSLEQRIAPTGTIELQSWNISSH